MQDAGKPVWFITGCSPGFGREIARMLLERGYRAVVTARPAEQVADIVEGHGRRARDLRAASGNQEGDSVRAAEAIIKAIKASDPPPRLLLGQMALQGARAKIDRLRRDFDNWAEVTKAADAPAS